MASFEDSTFSDSKTGFAEHKNIYPIIQPTPITPIQNSLLNSSFDYKFEEVNGDQNQDDSYGSIDPELMQTGMFHPSWIPNFNCDYPMEVDPSLIVGSNDRGSPSPLVESEDYASRTSQQLFQHFSLPDVPGHIDKGNAPSSFQPLTPSSSRLSSSRPSSFRVIDGPENLTKSALKVQFVDPMHPRAHIEYSAVFCCQIPICLRRCKKDYQESLLDFIKHWSRPTIASPLYGGRAANVLSPTENPDFRIPMLLLSGARVYKVESLGEDRVVRVFVCDVIKQNNRDKEKKYLEILPGGAVEQLGWINGLRDALALPGASSTWKCETHGALWNVSILEHLFDDGRDGSETPTPTMSTDYDSGYASSSGFMGTSSRKGGSIYGDRNDSVDYNGFMVGHDADQQQDSIHQYDHGTGNLNEDVLMGNTIENSHALPKIEELGFEGIEASEALGNIVGGEHTNVSDFIQPPEHYAWDDALLDEVNMFINSEADFDETLGHDFDII